MQVNIGNLVRKVNVPLETLVSVTMWDLPGREEMDLRKSYYTDISAAIGEGRHSFTWCTYLYRVRTPPGNP